jgi:hypothetical protein
MDHHAGPPHGDDTASHAARPSKPAREAVLVGGSATLVVGAVRTARCRRAAPGGEQSQVGLGAVDGYVLQVLDEELPVACCSRWVASGDPAWVAAECRVRRRN